VVSGLNHYAHSGDDGSSDPPSKYKNFFKQKLEEAKLLKDLYAHYQIGEGKPFYYNASDIDLGGATQSDLGLSGVKSKGVSLFKHGTLAQGLAFGELKFVRVGNSNQFTITKNKFDFDYHPKGTFPRNAATFVGGAMFGNFFETKIYLPQVYFLQPNKFYGGKFDVIFRGTITIPK
jgi:hypothetical protein